MCRNSPVGGSTQWGIPIWRALCPFLVSKNAPVNRASSFPNVCKTLPHFQIPRTDAGGIRVVRGVPLALNHGLSSHRHLGLTAHGACGGHACPPLPHSLQEPFPGHRNLFAISGSGFTDVVKLRLPGTQVDPLSLPDEIRGFRGSPTRHPALTQDPAWKGPLLCSISSNAQTPREKPQGGGRFRSLPPPRRNRLELRPTSCSASK